MSVPSGGRRSRLRRLLPLAIGLVAIVALVVGVDPRSLASALRQFDLRLVPALVGLSILYYLLQGLRWHALLRTERVPTTQLETTVLNLAGQSTALLPLGELSRAVFLSEATSTGFGLVSACVTVQELTYSVVLIAIAVPGSLGRTAAAVGVIAALVGTVVVFVILTVSAVFRRVLHAVSRVPGLRRFEPAVAELQLGVVDLLRQRVTYTSSWISLLQAGTAVTLMWTSAVGLRPGVVGWLDVAFVYAVINVASAITLSPGGVGAFELGGAGLLVAVGVPFDVAAATTIVHRAADKGVGTLVGFAAYAWARRRWDLGHVSLMGLARGGRPAAPVAPAPRSA